VQQQCRAEAPVVVDAVVVRLLAIKQTVADRAGEVRHRIVVLHLVVVEERKAIIIRQGVIELQVPDVTIKGAGVHEIVIAGETGDVRIGDKWKNVA
jgi:hypothetical protein